MNACLGIFALGYQIPTKTIIEDYMGRADCAQVVTFSFLLDSLADEDLRLLFGIAIILLYGGLYSEIVISSEDWTATGCGFCRETRI